MRITLYILVLLPPKNNIKPMKLFFSNCQHSQSKESLGNCHGQEELKEIDDYIQGVILGGILEEQRDIYKLSESE